VIKPHTFSNYQANNTKQFNLNMDMYAKKLQISMNSAVVAQFFPLSNAWILNWQTVYHTAKQKKTLYSGTTPHMKNIT